VASAALGLLVGGGFYMLLIDTASQPELEAGAAAMLMAAVAYEVSREQGFVEAVISPLWLLRSWRVISRVPVHIALVCFDAVAQIFTRAPRRGRFRAVSFDASGEGAADAGRRALAEALGSLAPNTIVVGIDTDRKLLLVHQLHRQGGRDELDPLRLG
jgi:multisubunit Na+/H+ antiporter MnhE subunit